MRFTKRNRNKGPTKAEAPKSAGARASPRKKAKVELEPNEKVVETKEMNSEETKNNRKPVKKGKTAKIIQKGNKKSNKKTDVSPKEDKKIVENEETEKITEEDVKPKEVEDNTNGNQAEEETPNRRGRSNPKAKVVPAKSKAQSTAGKKTPQVPKVKKATPVKTKVTPPPPPANVEKKNAAPTPTPTRISARGRKPKIIVDPSEDTNKPNGESDKSKKTAQKRKSTSKAPAAEDTNSKPKAAKRSTSRKSSAKSDRPMLTTMLQAQQLAPGASIASGEKKVHVTHIIEEQVVSPQVIETGAAASNGIPVLQTADLLLSDTNPQRFSKMIMQPSQELPAEIFQNEQTVTVTSPQKSPKILKLVLGPQGAGTSLLHGLNPVRGPAVIVKQNTAAGDIGNPDQITCLNVFNGSPRRSGTGNDSNGENGASTSDGRGGGDSDDNMSARYYNPLSPGKLVGEGLHNYCKSPLLAPAGTFPPSPTATKVPIQTQPSTKQTSTNSEAPEKKSRKRTVSSGVIETTPKNPRKVVASPPAPVGPSPTRRSARGNAGKPPKRDSMIEIPIVNRRRSSSTNLS